ncbi:MAG TPA: hypothetical protein C5S50_08355 [Methanosarcinaceae archaeon]|nr:hypothetical protein [Methanosarcinaceae archaeon]
MDEKSENKVFKSFPEIKMNLHSKDCFAHCFNDIFYAISCVNYLHDSKLDDTLGDRENNKLDIQRFEVNMPFRNKGIGTFVLFELLERMELYEHYIQIVEVTSISHESDMFYKSESINMQLQSNSESCYIGDKEWISKFMKSMTDEKRNEINGEIKLICNRLRIY